MIAYLYYRLRLQLACWRLRYWSIVTAGQRRVWHATHPKDSGRMLKAMQDRSKYRARVQDVWQ